MIEVGKAAAKEKAKDTASQVLRKTAAIKNKNFFI